MAVKMAWEKALINAKAKRFSKLDYTPQVLPLGRTMPETQAQVIERIMKASHLGIPYGSDEWNKAIGSEYDGDDIDFSEFVDGEDEFKQSLFAEYENEDYETPFATLETPAQGTNDNPSPTSQDALAESASSVTPAETEPKV